MVLTIICCIPIGFGLNISKISDVSLLGIRATVIFVKWVVVRASGLASFCKISELMDMESMFTLGKSFELSANLCL